MATLSELIVYPIKSCAGLSVSEATLTRAGLALGTIRDREWMLVDPSGTFLSQRTHPRMALLVPRIDKQTLALNAPGMPSLVLEPGQGQTRQVQVWDDRLPALDAGDAAAAWFSQALATPCRLVRFDPAVLRLASAKWTGTVEAPTMFADAFPLLAIGAASLADLNAKLAAAGRAALPMNRFRPNLVVDGLDPFEEDYVAAFEAGPVRIVPVKPCGRCPVPSVNQATGIRGPDPLDILQTYRANARMDGAICFGMNCIVGGGEGQLLTVGQQLGVTLAF